MLPVIKHKAGLLNLAEELCNVSKGWGMCHSFLIVSLLE